MTVSDLAQTCIWSPNTSGTRTAGISKVIVHHMAGDLTVEQCGAIFANPSRQASSNYGVGSDGRIACYLEEEMHPWTSSSYWADDRGITLEVADADTSDWSPSDAAYKATVELCADICNRYGIEPTYTGDADGSFLEHRMFAATSCPGDWWHDRLPQFIQDVKEAMKGREDYPMEFILHPDECGHLFYVNGNDISYIPHPDGVVAIDKLAEKTGTNVPHIEIGTLEAPWGLRFFQACGQEALYREIVYGEKPTEPTEQPAAQMPELSAIGDALAQLGEALKGL